MFLNHSTSRNEVIGKVEETGTLIWLYGHVRERYEERLETLRRITNIRRLDLDSLMKETVKMINENVKICLNKDTKKVRQTIRGEINIGIGNKKFIIDLSVLVTGTELTFTDEYPMEIEEQYVPYIESGELQIFGSVLAVETINLTIRFADEELENFSHQKTLGHFNLPDKIYNINTNQFLDITQHMMKDEYTKISRCARIYIERILESKRLKCK